MRYTKFVGAFVLCLAVTASAIAGGEKGNGAEHIIDEYNSAWFLGGTRIRACVIVDPNFGVDRKFIAAAIKKAESAWESYFFEKRVNRPISTIFSDGWMTGCRGDEPFVYYFGFQNTDVQKAIVRFTNPVAFAHRSEIDLRKGSSRGFVYVAPSGSLSTDGSFPDWNLTHNLAGILMHELGHVYGLTHLPQTIMDAKISDHLMKPDDERKRRLGSIDSNRDLSICMGCGLSKSGHLGFDSVDDPQSGRHSAAQNFKAFAGRVPVGPVVARVEGRLDQALVLRVDDFAGRFEANIELANGTSPSLDAHGEVDGLFRIAKLNASGAVEITSLPYGPRVLYGMLKMPSGTSASVSVEVNMATDVTLANGRVTIDGLTIKVLEPTGPRILFFAASYK